MVCGQLRQSCHQINVPHKLEGRKFIDAFRFFLYYNVLSFGLLRAPQKSLQATTSYVFISPHTDTILCEDDKIFLYGSSEDVIMALEVISNRKK